MKPTKACYRDVRCQHFLANLKALRIERKVSQEQMGKIIGIHQSAVSRVESGEQGLDLEQVILLCDFFNLTLEQMCTPPPEEPPKTEEPKP